MRSYSVPFANIDQSVAFKRLARETRGRLMDGSTTIRWTDGIARGQVKKWHLEAGLHMRVGPGFFGTSSIEQAGCTIIHHQ
jgi:hypothetical protein